MIDRPVWSKVKHWPPIQPSKSDRFWWGCIRKSEYISEYFEHLNIAEFFGLVANYLLQSFLVNLFWMERNSNIQTSEAQVWVPEVRLSGLHKIFNKLL